MFVWGEHAEAGSARHGEVETPPAHALLTACSGARRRQCARLAMRQIRTSRRSRRHRARGKSRGQRRGRFRYSAGAAWCEICTSGALLRSRQRPVILKTSWRAPSVRDRPILPRARSRCSHVHFQAGCTLKGGLWAAWSSHLTQQVTPCEFSCPMATRTGFGPSGPFRVCARVVAPQQRLRTSRRGPRASPVAATRPPRRIGLARRM